MFILRSVTRGYDSGCSPPDRTRRYIRVIRVIRVLIENGRALQRALTVQQTFDLLEIIEARTKHGATVFCTQYDTDGWYERINADPNQDSHIADAIMDRIVHNA